MVSRGDSTAAINRGGRKFVGFGKRSVQGGEGMMRTENEDTTFVERERGGNVLNSFWRRPIYERGPSRRGHQEFISQIKTPVREGWRRGGCSRNFSTVVERRGEGGGVEIRE